MIPTGTAGPASTGSAVPPGRSNSTNAALPAGDTPGLRTRDVSERAGINSATLHHYFPTKEALVEGVAAHLETRYLTDRAPLQATDRDVPPALRELRQEFADVTFFWRERPTTWAVSREFLLRAPRDEAVANLVRRLHDRWCAGVERVLAEGRDAHVFRARLDPSSAALAVVGALWGSIMLVHPTQARFDAVCREIEAGLVADAHQEKGSPQ